jgi:glycosyltransferase involved in cell wall biosynthesis
MHSVTVLMSTYNGEKYVEQQIDSILSQQDVDIKLLVRDDGSTDATLSILNKYGDRINIIRGENLGYAKSFWTLLRIARGTEYYAFSDQDDIWLPEKLFRSIASIENIKGPSLATGNVLRVDEKNNLQRGELFPIHGPLTLAQALQKSILPGCTFVFNESARALLARYDGVMESHDWLAYIVITALGQVSYVDEPGMLYRIHSNNAIGVDGWAQLQEKRFQRLLRPSLRIRSRVANDVLLTYEDILGSKEAETLAILACYRDSVANRIRLIFDQRFPGLAFKIYALLGRL